MMNKKEIKVEKNNVIIFTEYTDNRDRFNFLMKYFIKKTHWKLIYFYSYEDMITATFQSSSNKAFADFTFMK